MARKVFCDMCGIETEDNPDVRSIIQNHLMIDFTFIHINNETKKLTDTKLCLNCALKLLNKYTDIEWERIKKYEEVINDKKR